MDKALEQTTKYNISFFKPTTELSKRNVKLSLILLAIWATSVFGFHALLRIIETPTPEASYIAYESVWENIKTNKASVEETQVFIKSLALTTGKLLIADSDKEVLNKAIGYSLINIAKEKETLLNEKMNTFYSLGQVSISDNEYIQAKKEFSNIIASIINSEPYSLEAKLIPFAVKPSNTKEIDTDKVPVIMSKYLIHNQSFLTDTQFLGYPFHYFYTSVFLLILFIALCWIYCYQTDKIYEELDIQERV